MHVSSDEDGNVEIESLRLELKRCQRDLETSRGRLAQLESLFTNVADAIFVAELDGQVVDVNPAACITLGYTKAELLAFHLWDLVTSGSREEILGTVRSMLPGVPVTVRSTCRTKSGQHPIVDLNLARCNLGGRDLIIVTCRDVTVQQQAREDLERALAETQESEDRLRRNEAYLTEAQRLSRTGSFGWNVATGELFWSDETFCIVGYDRKIRPTLDLAFKRIHPEDIGFVQQTIDRAARDRVSLDFEHRLMMPDGAVKHVHVLAQPAKSSTGVLEFVGAVMDITERKRAEDALCRSEAYLTEAQKLSGTGSWCLRVASQELISSAQTVHIGGWGPGTNPSLEQALERVHPDDRLRVQTTLEKALQEESFLEYEHRLLLPDGTVRHVHTIANPMRDASGEIEFVGAVIDITEKKKSEDAMHAVTEALRASEHLARGQLEALTSTLAALSREGKPEKFLEHVLRMICLQLNACGIGVWAVSETIGYVELVADYEDDRLHLPTPEQMQVNPLVDVVRRNHPIWTEFFHGGIDWVYGEIDPEPPWARVAKDPNGPWYDNIGGPVANPNVSKMSERLSTLGVVATICVPMLVAGNVTGLFSIRFKEKRSFRQEEIALTQAMAHQATLAIRLMRLSQQSRAAAVSAERNRMARDIHDTLAQGFTGVIVQLEAAKGSVARSDFADVSKRIERASELARSSLREARRSVLALRPRSLQGRTLVTAMNDLLMRMTDGTSLRAELQVVGEERAIPVEWEEDLLRVIQEALTNTIKYAYARNFRAILDFSVDGIQLQLTDDGYGFDVESEHEGFGLTGMKERVDRMAGRFLIRSKHGEGTQIHVILSNPATSYLLK